MERLLSLTVILITTAIFIRWSRNSRRSRGKVSSQDGEDLGVNSSPRSSSASTLRGDGFEYAVFLSFRGADTRKGFTGHLYEALKVRGVETFIDSEKLEKGQKVEELFGYIQKSKIFVPVFSKGYADSTWCLKEIAKMVECGGLILPVFFHVEPRDVSHQTGPFAQAFKRHRKKGKIDIEEVNKWADALKQVGKISGYNLVATEGDESKLVGLIVKRILTEVNKAPLFVTKHGVGLDSRIADVIKVLELEAHNDVRMVGICAMGGMGKTTLAKAVYIQISSYFDACCIISSVREAARQSSGHVFLQEQLLRSVCEYETFVLTSVDQGIGIIKERIQRKKILLILDDVDDESQLDALAGGLDWFGSGSRIIVTTRNKQVLRAPRVNPNEIYELKVLDAAESLQLFSWHAFAAARPVDDFAELATEVAGTAGGLPLALSIFGSLFFDLKTAKEWRNMLERLKEDQNKDVHERLKISFDELDVAEQKIFLDIACFFIEDKRELPTILWEDCRFFPDTRIKVLMHKSLINVNDETGEFGMHDHIRDMGRKIVQDESLYNPRMCISRLWKEDQTIDALQNMQGTKDVEAIKLGGSVFDDPMAVEAKSFAGMPRLRMLLLGGNVRLEGEYEPFPKTLKWLQWSIPKHFKSLPACVVHLENIVILDLSHSYGINQVWNPQTSAGMKVYKKLKILNLSYCGNLTICPDFTSMPDLEKLDFEGCRKLSRLHPSIGHLKCLTHLSLNGCVSLEELPQEVGQLVSPQVLGQLVHHQSASNFFSASSSSNSQRKSYLFSPRFEYDVDLRGYGFEYDVYLSFRGADIRKGFTGHLYEALKDRGLETFIDSEELEKGQKVEELFGYIVRSEVFVPVFSRHYADSKWCLKEIATMVECRRLIIPVFLDVEPRDVSHQTGPFAPAFESYRNEGKIDVEEVSKWADALRQVGEISGYNLADTKGNEAKLIRLIVKRILTEVNKASL